MNLQGSKLIRQVTIRYKSQIHITCGKQADGAQFEFNSNLRTAKRHKIISILRQLSFSLICSVALFPESAVGQITPDNSAPTTVEQLESIMRINGGEREGDNLFHSFDEFSIPEGMEAIFENSTDIENIFTRVTGDEVSNIDGILTTQGDANFYFINPNGIVFGDGASLNVGGSFIASTAESVQFENGSEFSATNPEQPILDLSGFPTGLGLGSNPGAITVNGSGNQITSDSTSSPVDLGNTETGLTVPSGETLALVGNEITFNGGIITNNSGQIELSSVDSGIVNFQQAENGLTFNYESVTSFQDLNIAEQALINASDAGSIEFNGANIRIADGSLVLIQNTGQSSSGSININATESLKLEGTSPNSNVVSNLRTEAVEQGQGGDIIISTPQLLLEDAARIIANTYSDASGGNIVINAYDSIQLLDNASSTSFSLLSTSARSSGDAGSLKVSTQALEVLGGSVLGSSTFGSGSAADVTVTSNTIKVSGTKKLIFQDQPVQSLINSGSVSAGDAGSVTVNASELKVTDGGSINTSSIATGNAGSVVVNASDLIEVSGAEPENQSSIESSVRAVPGEQAVFGITSPPTGRAGDVTVNTSTLNVNSGGFVRVSNQGLGDAGKLSIDAEEINLNNTGSISAAAASGNGGDINIDADSLQLDNGSQITTEAGNEGDGGNITINTSNLTAKKNSNLTTSAVGGDGGNIEITADTILGLENSDITANAVGGNGGNITINTDLIYGYEPRSEVTPFEDITASSELGIDGTVTINSPETSTDEDITFSALKIEPRDYKKILRGSCLDENRPGRERFNYVGGGIPENPDNYYLDQEDEENSYPSPNRPTVEEVLQNRANYTPPPENNTNNTPPIWQPRDPIIPANSVEVRNGRTFLVAVNQMSEGGSSICDLKPENASPSALIQVKKIKITGNKVFSDDQLKNIIPFQEGQAITIEKLFQLQSKVTNYYINQGYASSGAFIASQETTGGVVEVQVVEGILSEVEIHGLSRFQRSYFTNRLPLGKPLKLDQLLSILTKLRNNPLIEDIDAKLIRLTPEKSRLVIKLQEKNPLQTQVSLSNSFSPSVGTFGGKANFNYHLAGKGDILNFGYSRTLKNGLIRYEAGYTFPINKYDGTINVNYTDAETNIVEEPTSALDIQADFKSYQFTARQPISLSRGEQLFVELGLEHIQSETFIDNDFSFAFTEGLPDGESKISALRLATEYIKKGETSALLLRSQFSLGIDLLDATVTNAGIDGLFWSWQGKAQWLKKLDNDLILASNLDIQLTPDKLLPIEQISLGGANSVRGYRQNLSIGDNGVIGSVELQIPLFEFLRFNDGVVKINPFIDGGGIWNNQDENIEDSTLLSFGAGVSLEIAEVLNARVDYGIPLIESDLPDDFNDGEKLTFSLVVTP